MRAPRYFSPPKASDFIELSDFSAIDTFHQITQVFILQAIKQTQVLSKSFSHLKGIDLCRNIYDFCKANIHYRFDQDGKEQIRLPRKTWQDRFLGVDCEDFTILISCLLHNLQVDHTIKMVDYGKGWQHIYVQVEQIIIDPVQDIFNYEDAYIKVKTHHFHFTTTLGSSPSSQSTLANQFVSIVENELLQGQKQHRSALQRLASQYGINDKTQLKELTELAIVKACRKIALNENSNRQKFNLIVQLYQNQVILSHRTSISILLQQYSTATPLAFLAGLYIKKGETTFDGQVFEPTAGNGMMTIAFEPNQCQVNEIDPLRWQNLMTQGFRRVTQEDANQWKPRQSFEAIITNPPFGACAPVVFAQKYTIKDLDHVLAIKALENLQNQGRAAIIIGGHTLYDAQGRIQAGKNRTFLSYLYRHFHVDDVININGELYARQGTSFNIRIILIRGRKIQPEGFAPLQDSSQDAVVHSFEQLFQRVSAHWQSQAPRLKYKYKLLIQKQALALTLL